MQMRTKLCVQGACLRLMSVIARGKSDCVGQKTGSRLRMKRILAAEWN